MRWYRPAKHTCRSLLSCPTGARAAQKQRNFVPGNGAPETHVPEGKNRYSIPCKYGMLVDINYDLLNRKSL